MLERSNKPSRRVGSSLLGTEASNPSPSTGESSELPTTLDCSQVQELAAAYADAAESPRHVEARGACHAGSRQSLVARAARSVSDAAAGIASVLIVAGAERADAEGLVGAHRASVNDKDPMAPVVVAGRLTEPVIVASGMEGATFLRRTAGSSGAGDSIFSALIEESGSQWTPRWRGQSRANSSLKPKFPASWENTGNFVRLGPRVRLLSWNRGTNSMIYNPIPYASEQGIYFGLAGN